MVLDLHIHPKIKIEPLVRQAGLQSKVVMMLALMLIKWFISQLIFSSGPKAWHNLYNKGLLLCEKLALWMGKFGHIAQGI